MCKIKTSLLIFVLSVAVGSAIHINKTCAITSASSEKSAVLTIHVANDSSPINPDEDNPDEDPEDGDNKEKSGTSTITPTDDNGKSGEIKSEDNIYVPNTGASSNVFENMIEQFKFPVLVVVVTSTVLICIVNIILRKKNAYRCSILGENFERNEFRIKSNRMINVTRFVAFSSVILLIFLCFSNNNPSEEVEATSPDQYPYPVSLSTEEEYDVYVKPGESSRIAIDFETTTENTTGYNISLATEDAILSSGNGSINSISEDTTKDFLDDNTWGISTDDVTYHKVPDADSEIFTIGGSSGAVPNGHTVTVYIMVKAGDDLPEGQYSTTLNIKSVTNTVYKTLSLANGNVATVTRISDNSRLDDGDQIILGEELKVSNTEDVAGILQDIVVNDTVVNNNYTFDVTNDTTVGTWDDSVHFLKNSYKPGSTTAYGYGDAILVKSKGKYWMIDTGMPNNVDYGGANGVSFAEYLDALNIKNVDYLLLTHAHADHTGGLGYLINNNYISANTKVYMRGCTAVQTEGGNNYTSQCQGILRNILSKVNKNNITTIVANNMPASDGFADKTTAEYANIRNTLKTSGVDFGNFHVSFYNIDSTYSTNRENANSIGTKFVYTPNSKSFFTGGDFELPNEVAYASAIGKVDVLKVGHHGGKSASSKEFLDILQPKDTIVTNMDEPDDQVAAWAYLHYQKSGDVYFTGNSTGRAIAVDFDESYSQGYKINKATKKTTFASEAYWYYWDWSSGSVGSYETPGSFCRFYYTYVSGGSLTINNNGKTCSYTKENLWR